MDAPVMDDPLTKVEKPVKEPEPPAAPKPGDRTLDAASILALQDLPTEPLFVPEWDGWVHVRTITAAERDLFEASFMNPAAAKAGKISYTFGDVRGRLAVLALVNPDGSQMFAPSQAKELAAKSAKALDRISDLARELAGMTEDDLKGLAEGFEDDPSER